MNFCPKKNTTKLVSSGVIAIGSILSVKTLNKLHLLKLVFSKSVPNIQQVAKPNRLERSTFRDSHKTVTIICIHEYVA